MIDLAEYAKTVGCFNTTMLLPRARHVDWDQASKIFTDESVEVFVQLKAFCGRIVFLPDGDFFVGNSIDLLHAKGDRVGPIFSQVALYSKVYLPLVELAERIRGRIKKYSKELGFKSPVVLEFEIRILDNNTSTTILTEAAFVNIDIKSFKKFNIPLGIEALKSSTRLSFCNLNDIAGQLIIPCAKRIATVNGLSLDSFVTEHSKPNGILARPKDKDFFGWALKNEARTKLVEIKA